MQRLIATALVLVLGAACSLESHRRTTPAAQACDSCMHDLMTYELAKGVYTLVSPPESEEIGSNIGFIVTTVGVVVVDAGLPGRQSTRLLEEIRKVTGQKIVALILTHKHWDHTVGVPFIVPEGTRVIAHQKAAEMLAREANDRFEMIRKRGDALAKALGDAVPVLPSETVASNRELNFGQTRIELISFAPAHTAGDLAVYLPQEKVLFAGGLVWNRLHPRIADRETDLDGWRTALDRISAMDVRVIVPGHGAPCSKDAVQALAIYLDELRRDARRSFLAGEYPAAAVQHIKPSVSEGWGEVRLLRPGRSILAASVAALYSRLAVTDLQAPCAFEIPPGFEVAEGGGNASNGWLRWQQHDPKKLRDFEVIWRPKSKAPPTIEDVRRSFLEFDTTHPEYSAEEIATKTLTIASQQVPVLIARWSFKEMPAQGGPTEWMAFQADDREYLIQFGSNVGQDEAKGREAIEVLETMANSFRVVR